MKLLFGSNLYPPAIGGSQAHLHCLAKEMLALDHEVQVITHTSRYRTDWLRLSTIRCEPRREYEFEGVPVFQLGYSRGTRVRMLPWVTSYYMLMGPAVRRISRLVVEEIERTDVAPSLVHVTRNGREFLSRACLTFARRRKIPFVLTPNHHPRWRGPLYRQYDNIYREADALLALTAAEKELLVHEKSVPEHRIHVTGIGPVLSGRFSIDDFRERYGLHERFVLYVGQQLKYKGLGTLLDAAPQVWERYPDVRFVFVGPHTPYSRKRFAERTDRRLLNLEHVDLDSKTSALAACEVLCLPSAQESFGGVFVEAWCHRKPVIGGRIPAIESIIDEEKDGLLTSQDPSELADRICQLLGSPECAAAMGNAGWKKVQEKYTWKAITRKILDVYQSLGAPTDASSLASIDVASADVPGV